MDRLEPDLSPPALSILDRLLEDTDREELPDPKDGRAALRRLRKSVQRDLVWLLNARTWPGSDEDDPLNETIHRFGLPDMSELNLKDEEEKGLLSRRIETAIEKFEPRLSQVKVIPGESVHAEGRTHFRIEAVLHREPDSETIGFDTTIVWQNRLVQVKE